MDDKIITALIGSPLLVALFTAIFKLVSERKNFEAEARSFVSTGLAVGYYYNFIRPIFERLRATNEIKVSIHQKNSGTEATQKFFKTDAVEIQIILPADLSESSLRAAQDYAQKFRQGALLRANGERDFAIHFSTEDAAGRLIIQDVATPLNAVRQYLEHLNEHKHAKPEASEMIATRQKQEIDNFIATVRLFAKEEGFADKKISFRPL